MSAVRSTATFALVTTLVAAAPAAAQVESVAAAPPSLVTGSVHGTVYDSIEGQPMVGATVYLWDTPHRAATDEEGRFAMEGVAPGEYSALFFHDRLGQLGVSPGPRMLTVFEDGDTEVYLATPSMSTVVTTQCLIEDRPDGAAAIAGRVVDGASTVPVGEARVTLSWQDGDSPVPRSVELETGPYGWYRSCAVPGDVPILLSASYYGLQGVRREVQVEPDGFTQASVQLFDQRPTSITGKLIDNESEEAVEGAEAWLRGTFYRVLTDNRGNFAFDDVPPGTYMLMTDHLAYGVKMDTLVVPPDERLLVEMRLDTRPIPMAPLTVTAEAPPVVIDRRRGGIVITRDEIDRVRQQSRDASDIIRSLHIPGVIVRRGSHGTCVGFTTGQVKMNQTGCVEMLVYINDVRATDPSIALHMSPDAIERMVVYKPLEAGNLFGLGGGNGVWMIYTRGN